MKTHLFKTFAIIGISLLFSANSYGQTKEETISWLKEKLGKYIPAATYGPEFSILSDFKILKVDECEISIGYNTKQPTTGLFCKIIETFPTNIDSVGREYGGFLFKSEVVKYEQYDCSDFSDNKIIYDSFCSIRIYKGEENIYERIEKALKHLATFCPKKTETF
uniref:hypothetical protein n=1 Tax=Flavobacterium sp. TaxID=239 RepID=UPI0040496C21